MTAVAKVASEEDRPSERRMTFFEHIEELRQRLKVIVIVVVVLFALFLTTGIGSVTVSGTQIPMLIPALGPTNPNVATQFVVAMKNYLVPERVGGIPLNFSFAPPWDAYVVMFKVAFFLAAVVGSPVIVYELGQFIGPALKPSEKRLILRITVPVVALFLSGVALCFIVVLPFTFNLLYSVQTVLGANFLVMYGLSALGIVRSDFWKKYWRFAAIAIFLFGAIITPDGSGITMFLVALPMLALYVVGYGAAVRVEHARARAKT